MKAVFGLFVVIFLVSSIKSCMMDEAIMDQDGVPDFVDIIKVSDIHLSPRPHHGLVISVTLHNRNANLLTPAFLYADEAPIWIGCEASSRNGRTRPVVMKLDWILGSETNDVAYPQLKPNETKMVDFSTKLDSDFAPINTGFAINNCKIGGNKFQAMYQVGINMHDTNRAERFTNSGEN